jgi:hypothetical protein
MCAKDQLPETEIMHLLRGVVFAGHEVNVLNSSHVLYLCLEQSVSLDRGQASDDGDCT